MYIYLVATACVRLAASFGGQEELEGLDKGGVEVGYVARVAEPLELVYVAVLVGLAGLYEAIAVVGLVFQIHEIVDRVGEGEYLKEVVVAQRVHDGLDELFGYFEAQTGHRAAPIEQYEHVLGRGGRHDVPRLEATVEEVLLGRHGPVGARIATEQAVRAAKVLPEELVVAVVVHLEAVVERLGPVGGHVDLDVLLEDVGGHVHGGLVAVDALLEVLEVLVERAIDARDVPEGRLLDLILERHRVVVVHLEVGALVRVVDEQVAECRCGRRCSRVRCRCHAAYSSGRSHSTSAAAANATSFA